MTSSRVRADYEQLTQIAQAFGQQAETAQRVLGALQNNLNTLQGGDWVGREAEAFYSEMHSAISAPFGSQNLGSAPGSTRYIRTVTTMRESILAYRRSLQAVVAVMLLTSLACGRYTSASPFIVTAPPITSAPSDVVTAPTHLPTFKVGDTVRLGSIVLVVLGWDELQPLDYARPDPGKMFVGVDLLIVNSAQFSGAYISLARVSLMDDAGQKYTLDIVACAAAKKDQIEGELEPGERVRGMVGFQVPVAAKGLRFVLENSTLDTSEAVVELGESPVAHAPPAKVEGEIEQPTFMVGETVRVETISVTVNEIKPVAGDPTLLPDAGYRFVVVDVTLENNGTEATNISSISNMWLKDPTGQRYRADLMATAAFGESVPEGEIAAGEKRRGQVAYQVPESMTGLLFVFSETVLGKDKIAVALP